ncbi:hypothetical protein MRS44_014496 [Fusarium solani]|uniref:uncharacterized protein n=1 Tax=Fusarium solani TaxID=169388 RepID=UPI0032C44A5A|nr:hypothetical protein MRS44_014496 [Fusarium solani]
MSSSRPTQAAPWRSAFLTHVNELDSPTFMLSTLHHDSSASVTPRSRTVVFRGLWAELPANPKNKAPLNPSLYESDLLTITTDARMEKIPELSPDGSSPAQSGGGGPVEAVFWAVPSRTQWRLRGELICLARISTTLQPHSEDSGSWDWAKEVTAHFGNLSPMMRGSFRNPAPGTPKTENPGPGLGLGQKVEDLDDEVARKNFRVVVIVPEEVDRVDLSDPEEGKRWNYRLTGDSWEETELWP